MPFRALYDKIDIQEVRKLKLHDKLKELDKYPFHMPGHKRNEEFNIIGSEIDITEIEGFDNLHAPRGIIAETEKRT